VAERLRRLPEVHDVWVGVNDGAESVLGAAVVSDRSALELRTAFRTDLPTWKVPRKWLVLAAFPTNARGKTDTRALRKLLF
ncbi:MAG: long-chain fatty acid--CoA ligase, partial [Verrucomicrobia bacterium]|nr:long-chain fatty acid--CoA ligase [Verrucomicrobiota bacterium]